MELSGFYLPEEIITNILSFNMVPYTTLVCKYMNSIEQSLTNFRVSKFSNKEWDLDIALKRDDWKYICYNIFNRTTPIVYGVSGQIYMRAFLEKKVNTIHTISEKIYTMEACHARQENILKDCICYNMRDPIKGIVSRCKEKDKSISTICSSTEWEDILMDILPICSYRDIQDAVCYNLFSTRRTEPVLLLMTYMCNMTIIKESICYEVSSKELSNF
jgi:hypothetical protein